MVRTMFGMLAILSMLAACGEDAATIAARKAEAEAKKDEDSAKAVVLKSLKDPDSAKFGKIKLVTFSKPDGNFAVKMGCLTVNARNAFGGYTGDQQAMVTSIKDTWALLSIDNMSHEICLEVVRRMFAK